MKSFLVIGFSAAIYFSFILPTQIFVANQELFDFPYGRLLIECLALFVIAAIVSLLLVRFLNRYNNLGTVLFIAFFICVYLETGLLSMGLPPINGGALGYSNPWRKLLDAGVLLGVALVVLLARKLVAKYACWIALVFLLMTSAMIFDAKKVNCGSSAEFSGKEYCSHLDVIQSVKFSKRRNVLVLILDSFPANIAKRIMLEDPDLKDKYKGFIAFNNNIGMHSFTSKGIPALMTGKFQNDLVAKETVPETLYGTNSFLNAYVGAGYDVYYSHAFSFPAFTNRRESFVGDERAPKGNTRICLLRSSLSVPYINLFETMLFRIYPYALKSKVLAQVSRRMKRDPMIGAYKREAYVYGKLSKAQTADVTNSVFASFHTVGTHEPIVRGRKGLLLDNPDNTPTGVANLGTYLLEVVGSFLDSLRKKGIYDQSLIVLTTDHGSMLMRDGSGNHGAESALLWIKPFNSLNAFENSEAPTSHCKVAGLMRASVNEDLTDKQIKAMLLTEERCFVATRNHAHWWTLPIYYQWKYDADGNIVSCNKLIFTD